jgi:hypothetical protein
VDAPADIPEAVVACLCAQWCGTCREFRPAFEALQAQGLRAMWIDIEDEADRVGDVHIEIFPTLLIVAGGHARFFGAVTPHAGVVADLVSRARRGALAPIAGDEAVRVLADAIVNGFTRDDAHTNEEAPSKP